MTAKIIIHFLIILPAGLSATQWILENLLETKPIVGNIIIEEDEVAEDAKIWSLCYVNYNDKRNNLRQDPNLPTIYFVTPTYARPEQVPELTRLSHTLMHVPRLHWIVADSDDKCSKYVMGILKNSGLPFTHLSSPIPDCSFDTNCKGSRGVPNRRAALDWIKENVGQGILYFGDDDNTYDLKLFDAIRNTKKLSMFPVGLIGTYGVSSPVIRDNKIIGFFDPYFNYRKFAVDMAGFAVNIEYLKDTASMSFVPGMLEDSFLKSCDFELKDIEPLADNCTQVLVWHTKTVKNKRLQLDMNVINSIYSNLAILLSTLTEMNLVRMQRDGTKVYIVQDNKYVLISQVLQSTKTKKEKCNYKMAYHARSEKKRQIIPIY